MLFQPIILFKGLFEINNDGAKIISDFTKENLSLYLGDTILIGGFLNR